MFSTYCCKAEGTVVDFPRGRYTNSLQQTLGENVNRQTQKEIRRHIRSDKVNKNVNPEKQSRHDRNSSGYISGRSYILEGVNVQELVNRYHGTGHVAISKGIWKNKETVTIDKVIGIHVDRLTGEETATNRFTIHYSNTGAHVVPAKRRW